EERLHVLGRVVLCVTSRVEVAPRGRAVLLVELAHARLARILRANRLRRRELPRVERGQRLAERVRGVGRAVAELPRRLEVRLRRVVLVEREVRAPERVVTRRVPQRPY